MPTNKDKDPELGQVISFTKIRQEKMEEKRRKYERTLFKHILGAYCVAEGQGLKAIELVDLSAEGLSFQLPKGSKNLEGMKNGQEMLFRIYFSQDTFLPIQIKVQNKRDCIENGETYTRFGCSVDTSFQSYETYKLFAMFLTKYAETSQQDKGDLKFFFF